MNKVDNFSLLIDGITLVLAAITWFAFSGVDAYRDIGGELLKNSSFDAGLADRRPSGAVDIHQRHSVDLSNRTVTGSHVIDQAIPRPENGLLRVTADARLRNVRRGPEAWQLARVDLLGLDAGGEWRWDFDHTLFVAGGTRDFRNFSRVFEIPDRFSQVRVEAELTGGTGTYLVDRLSARGVERRSGVALAKDVLLSAWVVWIAALIVLLAWTRSWRLFIALVPTGALLLFIPNDFRLWFEDLVTFPGLHLSLDHFGFFILMTLLALRGGARGFRLTPLLHLATLGVAVEAVQFYLPGRDSEFVDIVSDLLGIGVAALLYESWARLGGSGQVYD